MSDTEDKLQKVIEEQAMEIIRLTIKVKFLENRYVRCSTNRYTYPYEFE